MEGWEEGIVGVWNGRAHTALFKTNNVILMHIRERKLGQKEMTPIGSSYKVLGGGGAQRKTHGYVMMKNYSIVIEEIQLQIVTH